MLERWTEIRGTYLLRGGDRHQTQRNKTKRNEFMLPCAMKASLKNSKQLIKSLATHVHQTRHRALMARGVNERFEEIAQRRAEIRALNDIAREIARRIDSIPKEERSGESGEEKRECEFVVGQRVRVRDETSDPWEVGTVQSLNEDGRASVRPDGWDKCYHFRETELLREKEKEESRRRKRRLPRISAARVSPS